MEYVIKRRWFSSLPPIEVEIGAEYENAQEGVKLGAAVRVVVVGAASKGGVRADLTRAVLTDAVLTGADLTGADLTGAVLTDAVLTGAVLTGADLTGADLTGAVLTGADLTGADLTGADLRAFKADLWLTLLENKAEAPGVLKALQGGKVDGSTYTGECACLVGTIANVRGVPYVDIDHSASRPAERWFAMIKRGDTPETNFASKRAAEWVREFLETAP